MGKLIVEKYTIEEVEIRHNYGATFELCSIFDFEKDCFTAGSTERLEESNYHIALDKFNRIIEKECGNIKYTPQHMRKYTLERHIYSLDNADDSCDDYNKISTDVVLIRYIETSWQ